MIFWFRGEPSTIDEGGLTRLVFHTESATSLVIDHGVGNGGLQYDFHVSPRETTTYTLTAKGPGGTATASATVTVVPRPPLVLEPACSGPGCGVAGPTLFSGSGTGVWRFVNRTTVSQHLDVAIDGVLPTNEVVLLVSNPSTRMTAGTDWPALDPAVTPVSLEPAGPGPAPVAAIAGTPPVGTIRTWIETGTQPLVSHPAAVRAACPLPDGRQLVLWVALASAASGSFGDDDLAWYQATFCGASGGAARAFGLLGEPWGPGADRYGNVIHETAGAPRDVDLVFVEDVGQDWLAYFEEGSVFLPGLYDSNQALAIFVNAPWIHLDPSVVPGGRVLTTAVVIHQLAAMVDFYRHRVELGDFDSPWLAEMKARMALELILPVVTSERDPIFAESWVADYLTSTSPVPLDLSGVPVPTAPQMIGAFGAFLARGYGAGFLTAIQSCTTVFGVDCLQQAIVAAGGGGFADEFARFGASVFALIPPGGAPSGYGFPTMTRDGYALGSIDLTGQESRRVQRSDWGYYMPPLSHSFFAEPIGPGRTTYRRTGVPVPAGTTLLVVVR